MECNADGLDSLTATNCTYIMTRWLVVPSHAIHHNNLASTIVAVAAFVQEACYILDIRVTASEGMRATLIGNP